MSYPQRLMKELKDLQTSLPFSITAGPENADDLYNWCATMLGPQGSPYDGGIFHLKINFPKDYPFEPPKINFMTKIYHPNFSRDGRLCHVCWVCDFNSRWNPGQTAAKSLLEIQQLLKQPVNNGCGDREVIDLYKNDRQKYEDIAREWTQRYAME